MTAEDPVEFNPGGIIRLQAYEQMAKTQCWCGSMRDIYYILFV